MPRFEPPTQPQGMDDYFWGRYSIPVGQSVVRREGRFVVMPIPWIGHLVGLVDGEDYFLGGHVYQVSDAVAQQLIDDGFTVSSGGGYGVSPYGTEGYGR